MLHSLLSRNPPASIIIHFLQSPDLTSTVCDTLRRMVEGQGAQICFHVIADSEVDGLPRMERIPPIMWYRVLLPDLLPDLDRTLYLDTDTLVLDSLEPLWGTDLEGFYLGAVHNVFEPEFTRRPHELGLDSADGYFNSGVLLMNLAEMRRDHCAPRILEYARENASRLLWPDQDALNVVLGRRRRALHPRWNCQNSLFYFSYSREVFGAEAVAAACRNPGILHFEGAEMAKPWHYLCKHPYKPIYYKHLAQTPWSTIPVTGRSWKTRLLKPLPTNVAVSIIKKWRRMRGILRELR